jgi:hypothetical protein
MSLVALRLPASQFDYIASGKFAKGEKMQEAVSKACFFPQSR